MVTGGRENLRVPDDLMSAMELVDVAEVTVPYGGERVPLEVGRPRVHAVRGETMEPLCEAAVRRLLPTGWEWAQEHPQHIERCPRCLVLFPVL